MGDLLFLKTAQKEQMYTVILMQTQTKAIKRLKMRLKNGGVEKLIKLITRNLGKQINPTEENTTNN